MIVTSAPGWTRAPYQLCWACVLALDLIQSAQVILVRSWLAVRFFQSWSVMRCGDFTSADTLMHRCDRNLGIASLELVEHTKKGQALNEPVPF